VRNETTPYLFVLATTFSTDVGTRVCARPTKYTTSANSSFVRQIVRLQDQNHKSRWVYHSALTLLAICMNDGRPLPGVLCGDQQCPSGGVHVGTPSSGGGAPTTKNSIEPLKPKRIISELLRVGRWGRGRGCGFCPECMGPFVHAPVHLCTPHRVDVHTKHQCISLQMLDWFVRMRSYHP
jgi:hypothetical protein